MDKYILITGGCGYIGSHITLLLKERGYRIIVLDDLSTGQVANKLDGVIYEIGDIADNGCLYQLFSTYPIDTVMHLAAKISVEESATNPELYYDVNTIKTITLMKICAHHRVKRFFFSSTAAIYDESITRPIQEDDSINPRNIYGKTKYLAEMALYHLAKEYDIQLIIFRYFNVCGHHSSLTVGNYNKNSTALLPKICRNITAQNYSIPIQGNDYDTADGTTVRDYVHVMDIAHAHLLFVHNIRFLGFNQNTIVNIGYGQGLSVLDVVHLVNSLIGESKLRYHFVPRRKEDIVYSVANHSRISSMGWGSIFKNPYEDIIQSELAWCKKHFSTTECV